MAFINEWIKAEDRVEYNIPEYGKYTPTTWTIDKERNIILFEYADGGEYMPDIIRFALIINGEIFRYRMMRTITGDELFWEISPVTPKIESPNKEKADKILEEALMEYGFSGSPFKSFEKKIKNIYVKILYEGFVI